jgi:RecB family exonuclease
VRVPDLHAFRRAVVACSTEGPSDLVRSTVVVVPTRGAAHHLYRTYAASGSGRTVEGADAPALLTRDELYGLFNARLAAPLGFLTAYEREVILHTAAVQAVGTGAAPPFHLRPGLVAEMMRFYDLLRRQGQSVDRYEELLVESLDAEGDRGAERLLRQTRFLAASYRGYEQRLGTLAQVDEHALRAHLIRDRAADPLRRVVVAVGDWIADPHGLFAADFDLLARVPGLEQIDIVATTGLLASGFDQRVHDWLPGLDDLEGRALGVTTSPVPAILAPDREDGTLVWVHRDREEELVAVARRASGELDRSAVVFARPLPYLYLAREVFGSVRLPYQAIDTLPLAAEPAAAALDLIIEFVSSQFTRAAAVALLRSPQILLGGEWSRTAIAGLDRAMRERRYLGELDALRTLNDSNADADARAAGMAVARAAEVLQPLTVPAPASVQLGILASFLASHANPDAGARSVRACAALVTLLQSLAAAHASHGEPGDNIATIDDLAPDIRRWIEEETFDPRAGDAGIHLLDAQAARFGDFETITIVGMIEGEWPERARRNIFYSPAVLAALGWPSERDRRAASAAAFVDLVRSSSGQVVVSTFTFDDEALVEPSSLVEALEGARLSVVKEAALAAPVAPVVSSPAARLFEEEALSIDPVHFDALDPAARGWAVMRAARTRGADARYHGAAGLQEPRAWSVSAIETYLTCPFKFFAQYVMRLDEEREDDEVMDPKQQGRFVHQVFEVFFSTWQSRGHRAISATNLDAARRLFAEIVEERLKPLSEAEAALERTRLLGSPVAAGLGEVVFRMEAERPVEVVERLLEYRLGGEFEFVGPGGPRRIALKGVADRLDLLDDGTFRLIDYKSSAPTKSRSLQLPIYGLCAEQRLQSHRGRRWALGEAAYISFRGARRVTPLFTRRADRDQVLGAAQEKLIDAVEGIERGDFPPTPDDVFLCGFCSYGAVCRKDYVGDV